LVFRRERELASKVKAPAEAEKYKLEILAQANRVKSVAEVLQRNLLNQVKRASFTAITILLIQ
jgi:hypothetical protein